MTKPSLARSGRESKETRACAPCAGTGALVEHVEYRYPTGELVEVVTSCPACRGEGSMYVFVYPASKVRRS